MTQDDLERAARRAGLPVVVVESALADARRGPCQKSKRGAVAFSHHEPRRRIPGHNRPTCCISRSTEPLAFDRPGKPSRPSCITCARLMFAAGVRRVWLFGVAGWRSWTGHEFLLETLAELGLPGGST